MGIETHESEQIREFRVLFGSISGDTHTNRKCRVTGNSSGYVAANETSNDSQKYRRALEERKSAIAGLSTNTRSSPSPRPSSSPRPCSNPACGKQVGHKCVAVPGETKSDKKRVTVHFCCQKCKRDSVLLETGYFLWKRTFLFVKNKKVPNGVIKLKT